MGYRSEVAYKMWFETVHTRDAFIDLVLASEADRPELVRALGECEIGTEKRMAVYAELGVISFYAEDAKWYEEFEDVQMHHALLRFAEDLFGDENYGARFIRMGEESDDVAVDEYGADHLIACDELYVSRQLKVGAVDTPTTLADWRSKAGTGSVEPKAA